jgi:hypothetical protein
MYLSHQALESMHGEAVDRGLRWSELRRLRKERRALERQTVTRARTRSPVKILVALVRSM